MAALFLTICILSSSFLAISVFLFIRFFSSSSSDGPEIPGYEKLQMAGGRSEINFLFFNKQVQELGKYEYNSKLKEGEKGNLAFKKVVKAQQQLVSGRNYFLKVSAIQDGKPQLFDAVVYVNHNRENRLISFGPSSD
ncbi:cysteine proteinase inhibitor B-like [Papaver somniferum]|uniref:cysteine proteinase inhibitor B-like n=1 Tax=Papaver somniferum TaxID=3469 RepID=UPI000E6FDD54|nr:cysteine proteinase inhibitor B-like [Papaver somniferum]